MDDLPRVIPLRPSPAALPFAALPLATRAGLSACSGSVAGLAWVVLDHGDRELRWLLVGLFFAAVYVFLATGYSAVCESRARHGRRQWLSTTAASGSATLKVKLSSR